MSLKFKAAAARAPPSGRDEITRGVNFIHTLRHARVSDHVEQ